MSPDIHNAEGDSRARPSLAYQADARRGEGEEFTRRGSLATSEDLAQETFLAAWRRLSARRESEKLRPSLRTFAEL